MLWLHSSSVPIISAVVEGRMLSLPPQINDLGHLPRKAELSHMLVNKAEKRRSQYGGRPTGGTELVWYRYWDASLGPCGRCGCAPFVLQIGHYRSLIVWLGRLGPTIQHWVHTQSDWVAPNINALLRRC